jgi:hypothetical protein
MYSYFRKQISDSHIIVTIFVEIIESRIYRNQISVICASRLQITGIFAVATSAVCTQGNEVKELLENIDG